MTKIFGVITKNIGLLWNTYGTGCEIIEPTNIYQATLGNDVFVGPFCEIQRGVKIGDGTRIQSHTFICEKVTIGMNCFIGHGVIFTNDRLRQGVDRSGKTWEPTVIDAEVNIGSGTVLLPVFICSGVTIGAGSVVTKDIHEPGIYAGNPCKKL